MPVMGPLWIGAMMTETDNPVSRFLMPMYCQKCLTEYRDGFTECADCGVPLASGQPPSPDEHAVHLVTVLETSDPFAVTLAKASLEDAGIDNVIDRDYQSSTGGFPTQFGSAASRIQVSQENETDARGVLESLQEPDIEAGADQEP
jgi:hypothetical protein